ncbi:hypothetical protein T05_11999 [Trichinella murrelli]|uniref:Uncharacterized protein n=1 Tax=Trichinella murrelli TaxID=144512 RepID=A0A0V0ST13_9BILA|nr:hypothetical protein T05_11999 [Trichinella murrelli]
MKDCVIVVYQAFSKYGCITIKLPYMNYNNNGVNMLKTNV